jgi:hypothetical protein
MKNETAATMMSLFIFRIWRKTKKQENHLLVAIATVVQHCRSKATETIDIMSQVVQEQTKVQDGNDYDEEEKEKEDPCTCGHFLDAQHFAGPLTSTTSPSNSSSNKYYLDASFVQIPALLYHHHHHHHHPQPQHAVGTATRYYGRSNSNNNSSNGNGNNFWEIHQHLDELIRASQMGGDGVLLCADCISRYVRRCSVLYTVSK